VKFPREIWTYIFVTVVTVLIWFWAAAETRQAKTIYFGRVQFTVSDPDNWIITPTQQALTLNIEGSTLAIQNAESVAREALAAEVRQMEGAQSVDLAQALRNNPKLAETGVTIQSVEPALVEVALDRIERARVVVKPVLPGITTAEEIVADPPEVEIAMPRALRQRYPKDLVVEAVADRAELERLGPGVPVSLVARLRLPELVAGSGPATSPGAASATPANVTMTPSRVKLSFTIRSRTRETRLDAVRVQLAGPPEDRDAYVIEIEPRQLRDVRVSTDADLMRRIESNEVPVVAVVHISALEKENRIAAKPVSYFVALVPEGRGSTKGVIVNATVGDSTQMPLINLKITDRPLP
jgi:hypothetical protein